MTGLEKRACVLLALAAVAGWLFLPRTDFGGPAGLTEEAAGSVLSSGPTGVSFGGSPMGGAARPVLRHLYAFTLPDGRRVEGEGYATGRALRPGTAVTVVYDPDRPDVSRAGGLRRALYAPFEVLASVGGMLGLLAVLSGTVHLGIAVVVRLAERGLPERGIARGLVRGFGGTGPVSRPWIAFAAAVGLSWGTLLLVLALR